MGGKKSRDKGLRVERSIVNKHKEMGIESVLRVPLSGAAEGFKGDVVILDLVAEVKGRKNDFGFKVIKDWKGEQDILFIVEDKHSPLVVIDWELYKKFIMLYNENIGK